MHFSPRKLAPIDIVISDKTVRKDIAFFSSEKHAEVELLETIENNEETNWRKGRKMVHVSLLFFIYEIERTDVSDNLIKNEAESTAHDKKNITIWNMNKTGI